MAVFGDGTLREDKDKAVGSHATGDAVVLHPLVMRVGIGGRAGAGHASMRPAVPKREELEELVWVLEGAGCASWKSSIAHQVHRDATCVHVLRGLW